MTTKINYIRKISNYYGNIHFPFCLKFLIYLTRAGVAELVDAPDSKSGSGNRVGVQVSPPAPKRKCDVKS